MAVDLAVAIPTFIGGILSTLSTAFVLILFALSPKRRHFRHWLILNLTIADFINAGNNTISGLVVLSHGDLSPGPACRLNGWVGQFSIQAVDFSILAIALVALRLITQPARVSTMTTRSKVAWCASVWIVPLATSSAGLGMGLYGPVSGNWCWIQSQYLGLRYALTHGWRIGIVLLTVVIYVLVFILVKRRYRHLGSFQNNNNNTSSGHGGTRSGGDQTELSTIKVETAVRVQHDNITYPRPIQSTQDHSQLRNDHSRAPGSTAGADPRTTSSGPGPRFNGRRFPSVNHDRLANQQRNKTMQYAGIRRIMLLNGYPAFYILLWLPGLLNRLLESIDHSPRWLNALQASTQFIGLANALTYSYNEGVQQQIRSFTTGRRRLYDERLDYS